MPACLLETATVMTQSQAVKGNIAVTSYKGMNMISNQDFKLTTSVDILNVIPGE